jgi:hypothetical protein
VNEEASEIRGLLLVSLSHVAYGSLPTLAEGVTKGVLPWQCSRQVNIVQNDGSIIPVSMDYVARLQEVMEFWIPFK